jgi:hypothetical protein
MINRDSINANVITSVIALALAIGALLFWLVPSVFSAMLVGSNGVQNPSEQIARLVEQHEQQMVEYQARFNGRSAFFRPPARPVALPPPPPPPPPPPKEEPVEEPEEEPPPPPPPAPPAEYGGPPVLYVLGDLVVFRAESPGGQQRRVRVGQEREGLKVLSVHPPRKVVVQFEYGEYDVPIFNWAMPESSVGLNGIGAAVPGLLVADGDTDLDSFRTDEHYERISTGSDPSRAVLPRTPTRPGAASPSRPRATPPARRPTTGGTGR